jgi:hypothetical protein
MQKQVDIIVTGSGSLATEVMHGLTRTAIDNLAIALVGRDADRLAALARSAEESAAQSRMTVHPVVIDWSDDDLIRRVIGELHAKVLVHTASLQSPWTVAGMDGWSKLIQSQGFGLTAPLQAALAMKVARAIASESADTALVNGCYPDAVNRILSVNNLHVAAGLGNVAILAALLATGLPARLTEGKHLRVVAHHAHLAAVQDKRQLNPAMRVWLDEQPVDEEAAGWLNSATLQRNLNSVTGPIAAPMLLALARRVPFWRGHAPGPLGLPGGYPVSIDNGRIQLDLPRDITLAEAHAINKGGALADGIVIDDNGQASLSDAAREALETSAPDEVRYLASWSAREVEDRAMRLLALRERLGGQST